MSKEIYEGKVLIKESYYYGVYNLLKMIHPGSEFKAENDDCDISYEFDILLSILVVNGKNKQGENQNGQLQGAWSRQHQENVR